MGILAVGGIYGWEQYDACRTEKQQQAQALAQIAADAGAQQAKVKDCMAKSYAPPPASSKSSADVAKQVSAYPADFAAREQKQCDANPDAPLTGFSLSKGEWQEWTDFIPANSVALDFPVKAAPKQRHVKAGYDGDLTTLEDGNLVCGHYKEGEVVQLLEEDSVFIRVKTDDGTVGWAAVNNFEVVK